MPVTIRDVAKQLNLSITTVSRALDGYSDVSQATRKRVMEAAEELGYLPNRAARQLRRKRTDNIACILPVTPGSSDPFIASFISALANEASQNSIDLLVSSAPAGSTAEHQAYERWVCARRIDGFVIILLKEDDWRLTYLGGQHIPFVCLAHTPDKDGYLSVYVDWTSSISALVDLLARKGFKRIAFISHPIDSSMLADCSLGYQRALTMHNLTLDPQFFIQVEHTSTSAYQAARQLFRLAEPPDAILCMDDDIALGVRQAAYESGRVVGQDLALAGVDWHLDSLYSLPMSASINQPVAEITRHLVRLLLAEINHDTLDDRHIEIQPAVCQVVSTSEGGQE